MKKLLFFLSWAICVSSPQSFAQSFNKKIPNCELYATYPAANHNFSKNTIVKDNSDNIVFLGGAGTVYEIIMLDPAGNFFASKQITAPNGQILPLSLVHTYDDGFLVVGHYNGARPSNYPPHLAPGQVYNTGWGGDAVQTLFYAKFDNGLNLVDFKLHYGFPHNNGLLLSPLQYGVGVTKGYEDNGDEFYAILSEGFSGGDVWPVITKIDKNLVKVGERVVDFNAMGLGVNFYTFQNISWLANNEKLVITGYMDTDPSWPTQSYPFSVTLDKYLNFLTPATLIQVGADAQDCWDPWQANLVFNAIEDIDNEHLIWGFQVKRSEGITYPDCDFSGSYYTHDGANSNLFILKQRISDLAPIIWTEYSFPCAAVTHAGEIKNNFDERITIGFSEGIRHGNDTWWGPHGLNEKPAIVELDYDLNPLTHHVYNITDYTGVGFPNVDNWVCLKSFTPYLQEMPFVIHAAVDHGGTFVYSRIIRTNPLEGNENCRVPQDIYQSNPELVSSQYDVVAGYSETSSLKFSPVINDGYWDLEDCTHPKPTSVKTTSNSLGELSIYPNPTNDLCTIRYFSKNNISNIHVTVTSVTGATVLSQEYDRTSPDFQTRLDISKMSPGVYMLEVRSGTDRMTKKLIVQ